MVELQPWWCWFDNHCLGGDRRPTHFALRWITPCFTLFCWNLLLICALPNRIGILFTDFVTILDLGVVIVVTLQMYSHKKLKTTNIATDCPVLHFKYDDLMLDLSHLLRLYTTAPQLMTSSEVNCMNSPRHHQQWYQQPKITTKDEPSRVSREQSSPVFQRVRRAWLLRQRVSWAPDTGPEWSSPTRDDQATDGQVQVGMSRTSSREAKL